MTDTDQQRSQASISEDLIREIDDSFSGCFDGGIAMGQLCDELPELHRRVRPRRTMRRRLPIYTAFITWAGLGVDYVEHDGRLHVIGAWFHPASEGPTPKTDCVLGRCAYPEKYVGEPTSSDDGNDSDPA